MRIRECRSVVVAGVVVAAMVQLAACTSSSPKAPTAASPSSSRYAMAHDRGPDYSQDVSHIPDAVPRLEPRTKAGNKSPYTVLGKTYYVMADSKGYKERGHASWYGLKFHGARTSNGEIYDMYGMTAAHKTLPIPSFVQVTNLDNGKKVVVRVNDRGPFHEGRIIDLTYAAAKKLGFDTKGTAPVEVVAIDPATYSPVTGPTTAAASPSSREPSAPAPRQAAGYQLPANTFLQAGAFGSRESANALLNKLSGLTSYPVFITQLDDIQKLFRVRIGPISDNFELLNLSELIERQNLGVPHVVYD